MARPKKKISNPELSMDRLLEQAADLFVEPYDDRDGRDAALPSLRSVAEALGTTLLRARKLLITAECFSTETSRRVQHLLQQGRSIEEVMELTGLAFRNALAEQERAGCVSGPRKLEVPGVRSNLYAMFLRFGVIRAG